MMKQRVKQEKEEYDRFINDMEHSVKRILKDDQKRRSKQQSVGTKVSIIGSQTPADPPEIAKNSKVIKGKMPMIRDASPREENESSTPVKEERIEPMRESSQDIVARIKAKLEQSPYTETLNNTNTEPGNFIKQREIQERKELEQQRKPTLAQISQPDTEAMVRKAGHYFPGTVPAKPEHHVPRRLALSLWLNPDKKTHLDAGLSQQALKAALMNEVQGPTNWSSVDLRQKYRDEKTRTEAWMASLMREKEAERLRIEQEVFVPVVKVSRHPVHADFTKAVLEANIESLKRARSRVLLRTFCFDLIKMWATNRPANVHTAVKVDGLQGRRDPMAHELDDCQIQSVTPERAMIEDSGFNRVDPLDYHKSAIQKDDHLSEELVVSLDVAVNPDGTLRIASKKFPADASVKVFQRGDHYKVAVEMSHNSSKQTLKIVSDQMTEFTEASKYILENCNKQIQRLKIEKTEHMRSLAALEKTRQTEAHRAGWWSCVIAAAQQARFRFSDDRYASLAGYSTQEARSCINQLSEEGIQAYPVYRGSMFLNGKPFFVHVAMAENTLELGAVVFHFRSVSDMTSYACAASLSSIERCKKEKIQLRMMRSPSDWRTHLFSSLCASCRIEDDTVVLPELAALHTAWEQEQISTIEKNLNKKLNSRENQISHVCQPVNVSDAQLLTHALLSEGTFGVPESIFYQKALIQYRNRIHDPCVEEKDAEMELEYPQFFALDVCGRDISTIGTAPPSLSVYGSMALVPVQYKRDSEFSSTDSVTCLVSFCLDTPLKCPVLQAFNPVPVVPIQSQQDWIEIPCATEVAPFIVSDVVSKLDTRGAKTIMILNPHTVSMDIGNLIDRTLHYPGHIRNEPEKTPLQFRIHYVEQCLSVPNTTIPAFVFGVTKQAATLNAPDTWPHRYTWHSEDLTQVWLSRQRGWIDQSYMIFRLDTVGANDPRAYESFLTVGECRDIQSKSKTQQLKDEDDRVEKKKREEAEAELLEKIEAARISKVNADEKRMMLERELRDKRLLQERRLRGKNTAPTMEAWRARVNDPTTQQMGRWRGWQAYLYLDEQAKALLVKAAEERERERLRKIASGQPSKSVSEMQMEAFDLAVKEGTLFYHEEHTDIYQWDQPNGWDGVAILANPFGHTATDEAEELKAVSTGTSAAKNPNEHAQRAIQAASDIDKSRNLRTIETNIRNWLDAKISNLGYALDIRYYFREMDIQGTRLINHPEFRLGLAQLGLELPLQDQDAIIEYLDPRKTDTIDYAEFVYWVLETCPETVDYWNAVNIDMPELGPNTWKEMVQRDKKILTVAMYEEYKDSFTGQHYYRNMYSDECTWLAPEQVRLRKRQDRDALELQQAQEAASLAASAAVQSAQQAEKASLQSMESIVSNLVTSKTFVDMVVEQLGLQEYVKRQASVPKLSLAPVQGNSDTETDESNSDSDSETDSEDDNDAIEKWQTKTAKHISLAKPGREWRGLIAGISEPGFVTRSFRCYTSGPDENVWTQPNINRPSLVGVVDPVDVSHIPFETFPDMKVQLVTNIMDLKFGDAAELEAAEEERRQAGVDIHIKQDDPKMINLIMDALLAVKNGNIAKLEEVFDYGVDRNAKDEFGNSMLILACQQGSKRIVKFLLRRGCDVNAQNLNGNTALHYCHQYGHEKLMEYLVSKGADDSLLNKEGMTCYEGLTKDDIDGL